MPDELDAYLDPPQRPRDRVHSIASRIGIAPDLADDYLKLTRVESGHNVNVRDSSKGAKGFGQVMPDVKGGSTRTVGGRKYNLRDPDSNIEAGLRYFAEGGNDPVARRLHYFGGPRARQKYERTGKIPNISDGNMSAREYVRATGASQQQKPQGDLDQYLDSLDDYLDKPDSVPPRGSGQAPVLPKQATRTRRPRMEDPGKGLITAPATGYGLADPLVRREGAPNVNEMLTTARQSPEAEVSFQRRERIRKEVNQPGIANRGAIVSRIKNLLLPPDPEAEIESRVQTEKDAEAERRRVQSQFTPEDIQQTKAIADQLRRHGPGVKKGIDTALQGVTSSLLYKLAGLSDIPTLGQGDNPAGDWLRRKALAGELSIEEVSNLPQPEREQIAQFLTGMVAGLPEITAATAIGGPVGGFAALHGSEAIGRGQQATEVAKETAKGATLGAVLKGAGRTGSIPKELGAIGAGTAATELAFGATPEEAAQSAGANLLFAGGAKLLHRGRRARKVETKPDVTAQPETIEPTRRAAAAAPMETGAKDNIPRLRVPQEQASAGSQADASSAVGDGSAQRFYHRDWGEVEVLADQSGARRGRVKVAEVSDPTKQHFPKQADLRGRGNERMVPVKDPAAPDIEPYLDRSTTEGLPAEPAKTPQHPIAIRADEATQKESSASRLEASSTPEVSLSYDTMRGDKREIRYNIKSGDTELAALLVIKPDGVADIELTGPGAGALGVKNVLALKKQLGALHPEIKAVEFRREGSTGGQVGRERKLAVPSSSEVQEGDLPKVKVIGQGVGGTLAVLGVERKGQYRRMADLGIDGNGKPFIVVKGSPTLPEKVLTLSADETRTIVAEGRRVYDEFAAQNNLPPLKADPEIRLPAAPKPIEAAKEVIPSEATEVVSEPTKLRQPVLSKGEGPEKSGPTPSTMNRRPGEAGFALLRAGRARATGPVLAEVERVVAIEPPKRSRLAGGLRALPTRVQTALVAEFTPLRKLESELYGDRTLPPVNMARKFEQVAGAPAKAEADFIDFRKAVIDPIKQDANDFNSYLFLKRVADRLTKDPEQKRVADWTVQKAQQGLSELEAVVGKDKMKRFDEIGRVYQDEMRKALRLQVDSGRMTPELFQKIIDANDFYAPFKVLRHMEEGEARAGTGSRIATVQTLTKKITGIDSADFQIGNILQSSAEQIMRSRVLAEKNLKMLELGKLTEFDPDGRLIKKVEEGQTPRKGYDTVRYFEGGKPQTLEVTNDVAKAIQGMSGTQASVVAKAAMITRKSLQWGATSANAGFQAVNLFFADLPRAALVSRYGVRSAKDIYQFPMDWAYAITTSIKGNFGKPNELFMQWLRSGAANSTIQRELTPESFRPEPLGVGKRRPAKAVLDSVARFSNAIEETSKILGLKRGMEFENFDKLPPEQRTAMMERIAAEVRNYSGSPDFLRKGSETRSLNLLFMFFNARVQGTASDLARLAGKTGRREAVTAWARLGAAVGIPATTLAIVNSLPGYKEDYEQIPEWERDHYFMIPRESHFANEDTGEQVRDYWRIPKRELVKLFANTIESSVRFAVDRDPATAGKWATGMVENLSPINIEGKTLEERGQSVLGSINPLGKIPAETFSNRDFFRKRDIVPQHMKQAEPAEQYRASTSRSYVAAGKALGISPLKLEHVGSGLTGGGLSQFSLRESQPGRSSLAKYPILRRFVRSGAIAEDAGLSARVADAERKETTEQVIKRREAIKSLADWRGLSEIEVAVKLAEVRKRDPSLAKKIQEMRTEYKKGITYLDKRIKALGVKSGARKELIQSELDRLPANERAAFIVELRRKGIKF